MIPTYNCAHFLSETLESVLAQDLGPEQMQIEVVDDASTDDPAAVVDAVGKGRVTFFRQASNQGQIVNLSACVERARGEIVHLLHGDDFVLPGFYEALEQGFATGDDIGAAFCRWKTVDENGADLNVAESEQERAGVIPDALALLATEQRIVTPAIAVRRDVWERLGGFDSRLRCAEDWEMWVRIAAHYQVWYEPRVLAAYRRHDRSNTGRNTRNADELRYSKLAMELFEPLLPPARAKGIVGQARRTYARTALRNAEAFGENSDWQAVRANLSMAARLDPSPRTFAAAARTLWKAATK
jgi:glycosyltransferase involved in cell wall biosynthesis